MCGGDAVVMSGCMGYGCPVHECGWMVLCVTMQCVVSSGCSLLWV